MITDTGNSIKTGFFEKGVYFTSKYLKYQYGEKQGELIPIKVIEVRAEANEMVVDYGSGAGFETWNLEHCFWAAERGEYRMIPELRPMRMLLTVPSLIFESIKQGISKEHILPLTHHFAERFLDYHTNKKGLDNLVEGEYVFKRNWTTLQLQISHMPKDPTLEIELLGLKIKKIDNQLKFALQLGEIIH